MNRFLTGLLAIAMTVTVHAAENWPSWRGAKDSGSTTEGTYPTKLSQTDNLLWKAALPGIGCSTPIVWEDQIIVTSGADGQDAVICFDFEGEKQWQTLLGMERPGRHRSGSGSNPSPVTDGKHVFVYYKSGTLAALDLEGKVIWKTNLQERFAADALYWDLGTSPVLTERDVVVAVMTDAKSDSYIVAFEKSTGKLSWKTDREYKTPRENDHSYATPIVTQLNGREVILTWGAEHVTGHDAKTGELVWECGGFNPERNELWPVCASMVVVDDMAVVPYGRGARITGVKLDGSGDVTKTNREWVTLSSSCFVPTPAIFDGKLYMIRDEVRGEPRAKGEVVCLDPKDGKVIWRDRLPRSSSNFYASPTIAGDKLYITREDGMIFVGEFKDGWKLLAENDLGERVIGSPVPVRSKLLIRGENHLYCFGE